MFTSCQEEPPKKLSKLQRIDKAIEQEFEKTVDPALNEVPRQRLMKAKSYMDELLYNSPEGVIPGINWTERGPNNVSGRTRAILVDEGDPSYNTVYAGSVGGGLWKTSNAKATNPTWNPVNDLFGNLAVSSIAQDPNNSQTIYFGTGEGWFNADAIRGLGVYKSTDGGSSWAQLASTNNSTFHYNQKIIVTSNSTVIVSTRNNGVQRSTDGGNTWSKVLGSGVTAATNRAADLEIAANGDIYCSMGLFSTDGIYKSTDDGVTWSKLTASLPTSGYYRIELACAPSNANTVYAVYCGTNYDCSGIYRTDNAGGSWSSLPVPSAFGMSNFCRGQAWYDLICAVDPNNAARVYIGGIDLLVSSNSGASWSQFTQWYGGGGYQYVHADQHAMVFEPGNSNVLYFGNDGGIYRSDNASATTPGVDGIYDGYNVTQFYACAIHPTAGTNQFLAGAQDNGTQFYTAAGLNNTNEVTGGDGAFCHIDQDAPNVQISSYVYNYYWITTNGWGSYSTVNYSSSGRFINPTDYDNDQNVLYGAYSGGAYFLMTNVGAGNSPSNRSVAAFNGNQVSSVLADPNTTNRVWFGLSGSTNLVRVDNAQAGSPTASNRSVPGVNGYLSDIDVEDGNADHIIVCFSNYGVNSVWESVDGGLNWTSVEGNLPDMPIRSVKFAPGDAAKALVGTELGVWSTDNLSGGATNWAPTNSGLANVRVDQLQYRSSDNEIIAATHGRGLYSAPYPMSGVVVSVDNITDVSCNGGADGMAQVSATGGTAPYTYNWSNGATGASVSGLSAGTYGVTATDALSATGSTSVTIGEPSAINTSVSVTDESAPGAADGAVDLSVGGGTSPYSYNWSNGATSQDINGLSAGTYEVTVTDNNGCTATNAATVVTQMNITISSTIGSGSDDAEEDKKGTMTLGDTDIELVKLDNRSGNQRIGLRFGGLTIPQGANITSAYIQFTASGTTNTGGTINITAQNADNASTFTSNRNDVKNRSSVASSVSWSPSNWNTVGERGSNQQTPDISSVIQDVVDRPGWNSGNALAIMISGSGTKVSASYENGTYQAAELIVEFDGGGGMANIPPDVSITSPTDGASYTTLQSINVDASASDPDGVVSQVEFFVDGNSIGTDNTSPFGTSWTPASFGTYVLTAEATDDSLATTLSDPITVVFNDNVPVSVTLQVASSSDDAEEDKRGSMSLSDAVLELVKPDNRTGNQDIGLRFIGSIPAGATIQSADLEFVAASSSNTSGGKTIYGHDTDNSSTFSSGGGDISGRALTSASSGWSPSSWSTGNSYNSSDISAIVQEIVDRPGYSSGNAITIIIQGAGRRDAVSYDGNPADAPKLNITYVVPPKVDIDEKLEVQADWTLHTYPNPTSDYIILDINQTEVSTGTSKVIQVYNNAGNLIREIAWRADENQIKMHVSQLPEGVYHILVSDEIGHLARTHFVKIN